MLRQQRTARKRHRQGKLHMQPLRQYSPLFDKTRSSLVPRSTRISAGLRGIYRSFGNDTFTFQSKDGLYHVHQSMKAKFQINTRIVMNPN